LVKYDGKLYDNIKENQFLITVNKGVHFFKVRAINQLNTTGGWSELNSFYASEITTAIQNLGIHFSAQINIYPNPNIGILTIDSKNVDFKNYTSLALYSLQGSKIWASGSKLQNKTIVDISKLNTSKGMYILVKQTQGKVLAQKLSILK